jgi:trehalose-phosphatase
MKYLFSNWPDIAKRLRAARHRLYLFDIDGTLASIEKVPEAARIHALLRRLLYALSMGPRSTVGIISGRQLDDARDMVGLQHLIYAGNHGLEVCFNGSRHIEPQARNHAHALELIYQNAKQAFAAVPGALVEWKGLTMSLHYRMVEKKYMAKFKKIFQEDIMPRLARDKFQYREGKKVIEIIPIGDWSKGTVVEMLVRHFRKPVTIFVGDDVTDEGAFSVMGADDISVKVGHKEGSKAHYYLKNQGEVKKLLQRLVKL